MKIAQLVSLQESVPPKGKNGLEYVVHYLTEELVARGHEVTLFATADSVTRARLIKVLPHPMSRGGLFGFSPTHYALLNAAKAAEMADEFDVIHSHLGAAAYYFATLIDTPVVETVHSAYPLFAEKVSDLSLDKYLSDQRRRERSIHRVFVSRSQRKIFPARPNVSVVHNGIGLENFTFREQAGEYFAYLGYLTPEKGAHLAAEAALRTGAKLKIAGSYFGCDEYFHREIEPRLRLGQIEYVGVLGPEERDRFLGDARALLFPTQWEEPFGLVMIEAMACGIPVIGFDRAAVGEIVKDGETGFVVEDLEGMCRAMQEIDGVSRAKCRRRVERHFSSSRMAEEYEAIYEKVLARNNSKE